MPSLIKICYGNCEVQLSHSLTKYQVMKTYPLFN